MLVLTRKLMEKLYIGDDVCVTIVRLEGGQVRLGIEAPREVSVVRAELVDGRPTEKEAATLPAAWPVATTTPTAPIKIRPGAARGTDSRRRVPSR